jgi:hypothetical protein
VTVNQGDGENDSKCDVVFWTSVRNPTKSVWMPPRPSWSVENSQETRLTFKINSFLVTCEKSIKCEEVHKVRRSLKKCEEVFKKCEEVREKCAEV